ncbi:P-loop containing nucleoside triphosphate hydrolase protein [Coniochaeta sp. PMI_546]|nr:P-loop containing nucleoside triphosphate hydrolase protein [Coniochaeta sp. PMI_546]
MYARYIPPPKTKEAPKVEAQPAAAAGTFSTTATAPYARYIPAPKTKGAPTAAAPGPAPKKIVFAQDDETPAVLPKKIVFQDDASEESPKKRKRSGGNDDESSNKKDKKSKKSKSDDGGEGHIETSIKKIKRKKSKVDTAEQDDEDETARKQDKKERKKTRRSLAEDGEESVLAEQESTKPEDEAEQAPEAGDGSAKVKKEKRKKKSKAEPVEQDDDEQEDKLDKRHKAILERKEKALKQQKKLKENREDANEDGHGIAPEPEELHGLEPLPQPEPVALDGAKPTYDTLPHWLSHPFRVQSKTKAAFTDLGIESDAAQILASKGYREAFAVQTAAIPLLLPSLDRQGDLVVSAATGSGKTLAYVLPMVRDISQGVVTRLRGLIVVPTRELVRQAQEACEICAGAFSHGGRKRVKVGISMGSMAFKQAQAALVEEEQKYDPSGYQAYLRKRNQIVNLDDSDDEDDSKPTLDPQTKPLPDHVIENVSKVDILICTPGRLVEHIKQTPGFTLDYVRWLVVDEADKLLAQSFQQWLDVVMNKLSTEIPGARDFPHSNKSGVRKVILSATMTRDLSLLNGLKLRRPKLVLLEGTSEEDNQDGAAPEGEHVLPDLLKELVIKIRDSNLKPLYLVDLLNSKHMVAMNKASDTEKAPQGDESDASSSSSASDSDSDSESDSDASSTSSAAPKSSIPNTFDTTVLIFTKSNESALRLSRLLAILSPHLSSLIGTLTSTTPTAIRRRTLASFSHRKTRILVASDLVARGIDLPDLDHVVNYDVPGSAAAYVHRVGRTARAGRKGCAWTLVSNAEAAWFFREIGGEGKGKESGRVRRSGKVERVRIGDVGEDGFGEERVKAYESALEQLGKEAGEGRRRK